MKRIVCVFLLVLMLGGIFVVPTMHTQVFEGLPQQTVPSRDFDISAEGDLSSDSITSFSETTVDDVLFYPDVFYNISLDKADSSEGETDGSYTDTHDQDGTSLRGGSAMAVPNLNVSVDTDTQGGGKIEGYSYAIYTQGIAGGTSDLSMWDDVNSEWDKLADLAGGSYEWVNGTTYVPDYLDASSVDFHWEDANQAMLYVDYIEITFYIMAFADSEHYVESFADVSDWFAGGSQEAGSELTTNGDVADFKFDIDSGRVNNLFTLKFSV